MWDHWPRVPPPRWKPSPTRYENSYAARRRRRSLRSRRRGGRGAIAHHFRKRIRRGEYVDRQRIEALPCATQYRTTNRNRGHDQASMIAHGSSHRREVWLPVPLPHRGVAVRPDVGPARVATRQRSRTSQEINRCNSPPSTVATTDSLACARSTLPGRSCGALAVGDRPTRDVAAGRGLSGDLYVHCLGSNENVL